MSPERQWDRVAELFGRLHGLPDEERRQELEATEDVDLRAEVEALLASHDTLTSEVDGFLSRLDPVRAEALLDRWEGALEAEAEIGRYRIVRRLASGGMGVVYLAHDPALDRPVALKLLPPFLSANPAAIRRLREEARAASALDHPQIETVYEIGQTEDGRTFIAMAFYDGETLRERIERGPIPVPEAIELGVQLAVGLSAAHRSGIIHRDIKPENLLVTEEGTLKIVDFGVAKLVREELPTAGLPRGTAAYMSPEQTRGERVDPRTDLWSVGVVLYEMLTRRRPFLAEGEALIHAIRHDLHPPLSTARPEVPARLALCVEQCLEKERDNRPGSADELLAVLRGAVPEDAIGHAPAGRVRRHRRLAGMLVALGVAVAIGIFARGGRNAPPAASGEPAPAVAVLPFQVRGEGLEIWREGMVDLLSIALDGTPDVRAIDSQTVIAGWRGRMRDGGTPDLAAALEVARGTGARYAVTGSVISRGQELRLVARVHRVEDVRTLGTFQVGGPPDSLFALADRLAIDVLATIWQGEERPTAAVDLSRITTSSLPALGAFLEGESRLRRGDWEGAVAAYEQAVAADSTFAYALYHLGLAYGWAGQGDREVAAYGRAERYAGRLPERERLLFRATNLSRSSDLFTQVALLEEATRRYPDDVDAWYFLADHYWHEGRELLIGREASERAFRKVVDLDPGFAPAYVHLLNNAFTLVDSARAGRLIEVYRQLTPDSEYDRLNRVAFGLVFGDSAQRSRSYGAFDTLPTGIQTELTTAYLGHPRFWSLRVELLERTHRTADPPGPLLTWTLFETNLFLGRLRRADATLDDPRIFPGWRAAGFYRIHSAGLSLPDARLEEALAPSSPGDDLLPASLQWTLSSFYQGAFAVDRGRWAEHASAVARLRDEADRLLNAGDSVRSRFASGAATALSGRGFQIRGETERALRLLTAGQRGTAGYSVSGALLNDTIRWWIGELLLETGKPGEAVPYYESFWNDPLAAWRLAPIYERIGKPARARDAWTQMADAWKNGDPAFQERARVAATAVRRLEKSRE